MAKLQKFDEGWRVIEPLDGEEVVIGTVVDGDVLTFSSETGFHECSDGLREIADLMDGLEKEQAAAAGGK